MRTGLESRLRSKAVDMLTACAFLAMPFVFFVTLSSGGTQSLSFRFTFSEVLFSILALILVLQSGRKALLSAVPPLPIVLLLAAFLISGVRWYSRSTSLEVFQFLAVFGIPFAAVRMICRTGEGKSKTSRLFAGAGLVAVILALAQLLGGTRTFYIGGGLPNNYLYGFFVLITYPYLAGALADSGSGRDRETALIGLLLLAAVSSTISDTGLLLCLVAEWGILSAIRWRMPKAAVALAGAILLCLPLHFTLHGKEARRSILPYETADIASAYYRSQQLAVNRPEPFLRLHRGRRDVAVAAAIQRPPAAEFPDPGDRVDRGILKQRYAEWIAASRMIGDFPAAGVGPGNYQKRIGEFYSPMPKLNTSEPDTQNGWMVLGSTIGLPGMLAALAALAMGGIRGAGPAGEGKNSPSRREWVACSGTAACWGAIGGLFWTNGFQTGTLIPLAALLALTLSGEKNTGGPPILQPSLRGGSPAVRRVWSVGIWLLAIALLVPHMTGHVAGPRRYLWQEAEKPERVEEPMAARSGVDASGGGYLSIPEGAGTGWRNEGGGNATYRFHLPEPGSYTLWARTRWSDGCGNAFYVRFNNDEKDLILGNDSQFGEWHWVAIRNVPIHGKEATVTFSNREDGVDLDKLLLTSDPDYRPKGKWELVYSRDFAGGDSNGWLMPAPQYWVRQNDGEFSGVVLKKPPAAPPFWLLRDSLHADFRLDVRFRLFESEANLLVPYKYEDPDFFFAAEVERTRARLIRRYRGERMVLAEKAIPNLEGRAARLELLVRNGFTTLLIDGSPVVEYVDRQVADGRCGFGTDRGGAGVASFDLSPLEGVYWVEEFKDGPRPDGDGPGVVRIGTSEWANYQIQMDCAEGRLPGHLRLCCRDDGKTGYEVKTSREALRIRALRNNETVEEKSIPLPASVRNSLDSLTVRSFDRTLTAVVNGREIGQATFSNAVPMQGSIELSPKGLRRVEVRELRRFYDGFGGCDGNNMASWTPLGGTWKVISDSSGEYADCFGQMSGESAIALAGEAFWEEYTVSLSVRSAGGNGIGFLYNYGDDRNYELVRWAPADAEVSYAGKVQLVRRIDGVDRVDATADLPLDNDRWYEIKRTSNPDGDSIIVDGEEQLRASEMPGAHGRVGLYSDRNAGSFFDNVTVDFF